VLARKESRLPFACAVALIAAAIGDPIVEAISNTGIFGHGYSDNNHLGVIPTLIAGTALYVLLVIRLYLAKVNLCEITSRSKRSRRSATELRDDWLIDIARYVNARPAAHDLPVIIALQFVALYLMESAEQLALGERLMGGTMWLGGPALFSVVAHTLITIACTLVIARVMRRIVKRVAQIVETAIEFLLDIRAVGDTGVFAHRRIGFVVARTQARHACRIGERAPPLLTLI
jgi:hypothetical protein